MRWRPRGAAGLPVAGAVQKAGQRLQAARAAVCLLLGATRCAARLPPPLPCSEREKFLALCGTSLVVIFFLTNVGATLFYALGLSMLLIGAHAALRVPDDLFLDDVPEAQQGGFLSLLTGGAKQQVATAIASAV